MSKKKRNQYKIEQDFDMPIDKKDPRESRKRWDL